MTPQGWKDRIPTQVGTRELSYHLFLHSQYLFFLMVALPPLLTKLSIQSLIISPQL